MVKVRVVKCSQKGYWYENHIGDIYTVKVVASGDYMFSDFGEIDKEDAEVVEDAEKGCDNCRYDRYNTPNDMYCDEYAGLCDKYNKWQPVEVVAGVGQDAPKTGTTEEAKHYQVAEVQPIELMQDLKKVLDLKYEIAKCKNSDYGDSFSIIMNKFNDYGINPYHAIYLRIADKFHRFENLIFNNNQQVKDESIADTLTDLSNYIDLFIAWKLKKES